jgi:hypothetical protein
MHREYAKRQRHLLLAIRRRAAASIPNGGRPAEFVDDLLDGTAFVDSAEGALSPTLRVRNISSRRWRSVDTLAPTDWSTAQAAEVLGEVTALFARQLTPLTACYRDLVSSGRWETLWLKQGRKWNQAVAKLLPATFSLTRTVPRVAELAFLSVLAPGTRVTPHCGPWNLRTNLHLGISIPGSCGLSVDGEARTWLAGEWLAFDDMFVHEVWNHSSAPRVVLVITVWNPELSEIEIGLFAAISDVLRSDEPRK